MKTAKTFRWEGAHRLPWHQGGCQNLHGHSYSLTIEIEGPVDERGMVVDFKEIKAVLKPLIVAWDHATLISVGDLELRRAVDLLDSKYYELPFDTTSENLCRYAAEYFLQNAGDTLAEKKITHVRVRIQETETCYAEVEVAVPAVAGQGDGHATQVHLPLAR